MMFTIEVQEIRRTNRIYKFQVKTFTTIKEIKGQLQRIFPFDVNSLHLFHPSRSLALSNHTTLHELGIDREGSFLMLSITVSSTGPQSVPVLEPVSKASLQDPACREMIQQVRQGLLSSHAGAPGKTDLLDCTGGVYFMKSAQGQIAAVFKPHDEEQGMLNNPKGYAGNGKVGLRKYFNPGEGYIREAAAYLLDVQNIASVPPTCIVHCEHPSFNYPQFSTTPTSYRSIYPKLGSLQQYVKAADTFEDISPSLISVYEIQKIALFDMRVLNCDRNSANILCVRKPIDQSPRAAVITNAAGTARRDSRSGSMTSNGEDVDYDAEIDMNEFMDRASISSSSRNNSGSGSNSSRGASDRYELIPIDHGYCLPSQLCIEDFDWVWFTTPHIEQPLDPRLKQYMKELNIEESIEGLRRQGLALSEDALFLLRLTHQLIVQGIEEGLTLKEIASLICRTEDGVPSALEKAIASAEENAQRAVEVHGGNLNQKSSGNGSGSVAISPPRKMVTRSPLTTTSTLFNTTAPGGVGGGGGGLSKIQSSGAILPPSQLTPPPSAGPPLSLPGGGSNKSMKKDEPQDLQHQIVNNVLLLPKATTATATMYPMMSSSSSSMMKNQGGALPRSYASSPLVTPPKNHLMNNNTTAVKMEEVVESQALEGGAVVMKDEDEDFADFLLRDSYLRPKGPISFLNTLDSKMLPRGVTKSSTGTSSSAAVPLPLVMMTRMSSETTNSSPSPRTPQKELLFQHGSYFHQHFSATATTTTPSAAPPLSGGQVVLREESNGSTSHDETDYLYDSSNSSSSQEENGPPNRTGSASSFYPVRSPDLALPRSRSYQATTMTEVVEVVGEEELGHNFLDDEEEDGGGLKKSFMSTASVDTGLRRVNSFSNVEVQITEPMVFHDKPSRSHHNRSSSSGGGGGGHPTSGFTSEEEEVFEDHSGHGGVSSSCGDISPYSDLLGSLPLPPSTSSSANPSSFTGSLLAQKFLGGGVGAAPGLTRVVSFNAFESPALYEVDRTDRHFNRLKREKRKLSVKSPEFQELRMQFAERAIVKTIAARLPSSSHHNNKPLLGTMSVASKE